MTETLFASPLGWFALAASLALTLYFYFEWRKADANRVSVMQENAAARAKLEQLETIRAERDAAFAAREAAQDEASLLAARIAGLESAAAANIAAASEREAALSAMKADVERTFQALATQALDANQQRFIALANETFSKHQTAAAGTVKEVVAPVQEQFAKLSDTIQALEKARLQDKSSLGEQMREIGDTLKQTQAMTGKLANALRAAPKARGRWGEETLKNVLELAGLTSRIDFVTEQSFKGEEGTMRPDVTIRLPGGRCIVVDSKVALSGYLDAMDAIDDSTREAHLRKHAAELGQHAKLLGQKDYWRTVPETADFVVMFVPGENFIAAAFERDPDMFETAMRNRVIIVGPSSLLALARSIAYGWRQEEMAKNAELIAGLGRELFTRLAKFSELISAVGGSLDKSVKDYNKLVASFDARVIVTARKFKELGADEGGEIADVGLIESAPRLPAPQAELDLPPPSQGNRKKAS
jgi:DNA recombination protein RmuC